MGNAPLHSPHALQQHFLDQANWHSPKIVLHSQETHAFASIGLLGGSTFSTFSHQTLTLWQAERFAAAGLNVLLNVALGLFAAWLGWRLGRTI